MSEWDADKFIVIHKKESQRETPVDSLGKKRILFTPPFNGDNLFNRTSQNLKCATKYTYYYAERNILHTTYGLGLKRQRTKLTDVNVA